MLVPRTACHLLADHSPDFTAIAVPSAIWTGPGQRGLDAGSTAFCWTWASAPSNWTIPDKGFSYRADGPLDLRFNQDTGLTAAELVADLDEKDLADLIWKWGEERASRRIARAVVRARAEDPVTTTGACVSWLKDALPRGVKPCRRSAGFFRPCVSRSTRNWRPWPRPWPELPRVLKPGGCFVVISYHSLEDRLVKRFIDREKRDCLCPPELPAVSAAMCEYWSP